MLRPKLKDNKHKKAFELYPLGHIPDNIVHEIGKWIVYNFAVGIRDIDGEDWGDIFSKSIGGDHLNKPVGLADVVHGTMAWSAKSIKANKPHTTKKARVISGRCSPDYSHGISDPHEDLAATGTAVLSIWNERISVAKDRYEPLWSMLLIRNPDTMEFSLFEHELSRYNTKDYLWSVNKNGNLIGREAGSGKHKFTWQPHGSQLTIHYDIPGSTTKFKVKKPPVLDAVNTMKQIGFDASWVTIL